MRIISFNANGIRSAQRKGFFDWLKTQDADVVCIQETKAKIHQLDGDLLEGLPFHSYFFDAEKPGYSGVALLSRQAPDQLIRGLGWPDMDAEGRYIEALFGNLSIVSIYLPSGSSGETRQAVKFKFLERFLPFLRARRETGRDFILCGDFNIAHKAIDLKNWRSNQKNSGFLPEERAWMDTLLSEDGWIDAFRELDPRPDQYTWWSNRGAAYAKNVGWRIDYQIITPSLRSSLQQATIYKTDRFSDHAPLIIDYARTLD